MSRNSGLAFAGIIWFIGLAAGATKLNNYVFTPGDPAVAYGPQWPASSAIHRAERKATLVIFAHPRCGCTSATLAELATIIPKMKQEPEIHIVFLKPKGRGLDWLQTDTWKQAEKIPGATLQIDELGVEAARFGARTSGQIFLYGVSGELKFNGGITPGRGHRGETPGQRFILEYLEGHPKLTKLEPVFGCSLGTMAKL